MQFLLYPHQSVTSEREVKFLPFAHKNCLLETGKNSVRTVGLHNKVGFHSKYFCMVTMKVSK